MFHGNKYFDQGQVGQLSDLGFPKKCPWKLVNFEANILDYYRNYFSKMRCHLNEAVTLNSSRSSVTSPGEVPKRIWESVICIDSDFLGSFYIDKRSIVVNWNVLWTSTSPRVHLVIKYFTLLHITVVLVDTAIEEEESRKNLFVNRPQNCKHGH